MATQKARKRSPDDLRAEYDLSKLKGGVRGKYLQRARASASIVLWSRRSESSPVAALKGIHPQA